MPNLGSKKIASAARFRVIAAPAPELVQENSYSSGATIENSCFSSGATSGKKLLPNSNRF